MHVCLCIHTVRLYKHAFFLSPSIHIHTFTGFRNANSRDHCLIPSCLWRQLVEIVREMQWSVKLSSETDGERERESERVGEQEKSVHTVLFIHIAQTLSRSSDSMCDGGICTIQNMADN